MYPTRSQLLLWIPVALGAGILCYFALAQEPSLMLVAGLGLAAGACALGLVFWKQKPLWALIVLHGLFWCALGFVVAKIQTDRAAHFVLPQAAPATMLHGTVAHSEDRGSGGTRIVLEQVNLWQWPVEKTPKKVRITARGEMPALAPGDRIAVKVVLSPPPPPVFPGGYDFARAAYFDQIGAVGFAVRPPEILEPASGFSRLVEAHRYRITGRIYSALETRYSQSITGITAALITGEAGRIEAADLASLRASGLGHILSISGLHLVLACSVIFVGLRALLALFPILALHHPIKKWAAFGAIFAGFYYLLIAGAPISAERAYIMIVLFFLAVLLDRTGSPMRPVAVAAFVLLLSAPESILGASFQMSFAAVVGLSAYFNTWREGTLQQTFFLRCWNHLRAIVLSSLVAGTATAPFAFYHFGQYAAYGLLGNMLVMPLTSFLIMPAGVLALLVMPLGLGLESFALRLMAWGIEGMLWVSDWVAGLPHATLHLPHMPPAALLLILLGGLWLCLMQGAWRRYGGIGIALGIVVYLSTPAPDMVLDGRGKLFAIRDATSQTLLVPNRQHARYAREYWTKALGLQRTLRFSELPREHPLADCTAEACAGKLGRFTFYRGPECRPVDILIRTIGNTQAPCYGAERTVTPEDLAQNGTHALWLFGHSPRLVTVQGARGQRPWTIH